MSGTQRALAALYLGRVSGEERLGAHPEVDELAAAAWLAGYDAAVEIVKLINSEEEA